MSETTYTPERVKALVAEGERKTSFWSGARWAAGLAQVVITTFGATIAIKICKVVGILW